MSFIIWLSHIVFVVPLLAYLVLRKEKTHAGAYYITGALAVFTLLYHGASLILGTKAATA